VAARRSAATFEYLGAFPWDVLLPLGLIPRSLSKVMTLVAADLRAAIIVEDADPAERIGVNLTLFERIIADPTPKSRRSYLDTSG